MSRQDSEPNEVQVTATSRHRWRRVAAWAGLTLSIGLVACGGDDDDAAESTEAPVTTTDASTSLPSEITEPPGSTEAPESGSAPATDTPDESAPAGDSEPAAAGTDAAGDATTDAPEAAAAAATATTLADAADGDDTTAGAALDVGPTTTGPACEFAENTTLPLERCNMGPAVAVLQSVLQAQGYDVGIDGEFGDQTLYALRAFQEAEGLAVDGIVGLQTWTALDVSAFGTDTNGDGVITPDEIDLTE